MFSDEIQYLWSKERQVDIKSLEGEREAILQKIGQETRGKKRKAEYKRYHQHEFIIISIEDSESSVCSMPDPAPQGPQPAVPQVPHVPQPPNVVHDIVTADAAPAPQD